MEEIGGSNPLGPTTALGEVVSHFRDMEELQVRFLQRRPRFCYHSAMGENREEILKKIQEAEEHEKHRRELEARDQAPVNLKSRMPWGCWIWIVGAIALAAWLIKKYGLGI